jgi:mevalonate kinase
VDYLERLEARRREEPRAVEAVLAGLGSISTEGVGALQGDRSSAFLRAVEAFWSGLEELERVLGVPVLSEPHRRLHELAASCGYVYKPSGAGGGDLGVALSTDPEGEAAMRHRFSAAGFVCLDLAFGRAAQAAVERL